MRRCGVVLVAVVRAHVPTSTQLDGLGCVVFFTVDEESARVVRDGRVKLEFVPEVYRGAFCMVLRPAH